MPTNYPIGPNDIAELLVYMTVNGQTCISSFHYIATGGSTPNGTGALIALGEALNAPGKLVDELADCIATNVSFDRCTIQAIWASRYRALEVVPAESFGQYVGTCQNPAVSACITKESIIAKKGNTGTLHIPGIAQEGQNQGKVISDLADQMGGLSIQMATVVTTVTPNVTWQPIIYSRESPLTSNFIQQCAVQRTLRTMRRRVVGRGI